MDKPTPNVIAFEVTARRPGPGGRPFRRVGVDFPLGRAVRVEASSLTPAKAEFLLDSDPRDLLVVVVVAQIYEDQQEAEGAASPGEASPFDTSDVSAQAAGTSEAEPDADGEDRPVGTDQADRESGDEEVAEDADSVITSSPPAPGRTPTPAKKGGRRR